MTRTINAGATLSIKLSLPHNQYENVDAGFYAGVSEEISDTLTDEQIAARMKEIQNFARNLCEEQVDKDIENVKEVKIYANLDDKSKRKGQLKAKGLA